MPSSKPFSIPAISKLIKKETLEGKVIEPFPFESKVDAFDFLSSIPSESVTTCLLDPPYSPRQVSEHYSSKGIAASSWQTSAGFWAKIKDEIARVVAPGGKCITLAWNSNGIGMNRGFEITRILICAHGSWHNDTICTVERKAVSNKL